MSVFYADVKISDLDISLFEYKTDTISKKNFWKKDVVEIAFVPSVFFGATAMTWNGREHILETRNKYIPEFANTFDDYLQYGPGVLAFSLKAAGVKGRNNTKRSVYNYLGSTLLTGVFVNSLKYTTKVMRPDESSANSWPSGHAAVAFMNASYLDKEYGLVSPMYSITGYGMAIMTGVGRSMNNRHWSPDILAGAGFGILSTNLAYFFIDKIYGNEGDNLSLLSRIEGNENPSFLAVRAGFSFSSSGILEFHREGPNAKVGWEAGFEGAYFFDGNLGIGGEFVVWGFPMDENAISGLINSEVAEEYNLSYVSNALGFMNVGIGPYYAFHFSEDFNLMLKATGGYSFGAIGYIEAKQNDSSLGLPEAIENNRIVSSYKPHSAFRWSFGSSFTYNLTDQLGISIYGDYSGSNPIVKYYPGNPLLSAEKSKENSSKINLQYISTGLRLIAYF